MIQMGFRQIQSWKSWKKKVLNDSDVIQIDSDFIL